jgi:Tol biopolymer transport system component
MRKLRAGVEAVRRKAAPIAMLALIALGAGLLARGAWLLSRPRPDSDLWIAYIFGVDATDRATAYYGTKEIFATDSDGQQHYQLTDSQDLESFPAWSPDGAWLAFTRAQNQHYVSYDEVSWMRPGASPLNCNPYSIDSMPVWSPDSRMIAFSSNESAPGGASFPIYVSPAESCQPTRLLPAGKGGKLAGWSPDGEWLLFLAGWKGPLHRMRADGSAITLLAADEEIYHASWSPDGAWIAYETTRDGRRQIYRIRPDGGDPLQLTAIAGADNDSLAWSPDGRWLAFRSLRQIGVDERSGRQRFESAIYRVRPDGSELALISGAGDHQPSWSPDGQWLAFVSDRTGRDQIYRVRPDGSEVRQLTHSDSGSSSRPAWGRLPAESVQAILNQAQRGGRWQIGLGLIALAIGGAGTLWVAELRRRRRRAAQGA